MRTSPEHVRAYLELVAFWEDAGLYDPDRKLDMDSLIALARAQTNVVVLEAAPGEDCVAVTSSPQTTRSPVIHRRRRLAVAAAAAAAVVCVMVAIGGWSALYHDPSYATDVGEQRTVRLSDGSTVELNAVSRIRVRFSQHERAVDLLLGQALFRVAKNKDRPFLVFSGATRVRAVGTQFDVNRERSSTVVTVLEGRVAVVPQRDSTLDSALPHPAAPPIEIAAGEQLTVLPSASPRKQRANVAVTTAWT
ncbi:MAG: FecR family protein, partial [Steroidobacteraceae bacterium]